MYLSIFLIYVVLILYSIYFYFIDLKKGSNSGDGYNYIFSFKKFFVLLVFLFILCYFWYSRDFFTRERDLLLYYNNLKFFVLGINTVIDTNLISNNFYFVNLFLCVSIFCLLLIIVIRYYIILINILVNCFESFHFLLLNLESYKYFVYVVYKYYDYFFLKYRFIESLIRILAFFPLVCFILLGLYNIIYNNLILVSYYYFFYFFILYRIFYGIFCFYTVNSYSKETVENISNILYPKIVNSRIYLSYMDIKQRLIISFNLKLITFFRSRLFSYFIVFVLFTFMFVSLFFLFNFKIVWKNEYTFLNDFSYDIVFLFCLIFVFLLLVCYSFLYFSDFKYSISKFICIVYMLFSIFIVFYIFYKLAYFFGYNSIILTNNKMFYEKITDFLFKGCYFDVIYLRSVIDKKIFIINYFQSIPEYSITIVIDFLNSLSDDELKNMTIDELILKVRNLFICTEIYSIVSVFQHMFIFIISVSVLKFLLAHL